jgi:hypothetical protein
MLEIMYYVIYNDYELRILDLRYMYNRIQQEVQIIKHARLLFVQGKIIRVIIRGHAQLYQRYMDTKIYKNKNLTY